MPKGLLIADDSRVAEVAPLCLREGLGIEVQALSDPRFYESSPNAVEVHQSSLAGIGTRALHAPFRDLRPGSGDRLIREVSYRRIAEGCRFAARVSANYVVVHNGYVPGTTPESYWCERAISFWKEILAAHAGPFVLYLENHLEDSPDMLARIADGVGDARFRLNLDIGHVHCHSPRGITRWIERLGERIGYVHLHDNHGLADEHLGLGKGTIPLVEVCAALEKHAPAALWVVESEGAGIQESLAWLRDQGFRH